MLAFLILFDRLGDRVEQTPRTVCSPPLLEPDAGLVSSRGGLNEMAPISPA